MRKLASHRRAVVPGGDRLHALPSRSQNEYARRGRGERVEFIAGEDDVTMHEPPMRSRHILSNNNVRVGTQF
jgi:hypothetical protein